MSRALLALVVTSSVGLLGCPGELEHPERFDGVVACRSGIQIETLFANKCGGSLCHGGGAPAPAGGLDLTSPGLARRLVGVPAQECEGFLRVDPVHPDDSFLLGKLIEPPAGCGDRMPLVGMLSAAEIACVRAYIRSIADERFDAGPTPVSDAGADASMPDASMPDASLPDLDAGDLDAGGMSDGGGP